MLSPAVTQRKAPGVIGSGALVVQRGELLMILDPHRQGLSVTAVPANRSRSQDRPQIHRARARTRRLWPATGGAAKQDRALRRLPARTGHSRLTREIRERGYDGAYTAVKRLVAAIRPQEQVRPFEVRFETAAGYRAQLDFARFVTELTDAPGVTRIVLAVLARAWPLALHLRPLRHAPAVKVKT